MEKDMATHSSILAWRIPGMREPGGLPSMGSHSLWPLPLLGFPGGSDSKESACNAGDPGLVPGSGKSPGEGNGNPLQYSCLENPRDEGAWWAAVYAVLPNTTKWNTVK